MNINVFKISEYPIVRYTEIPLFLLIYLVNYNNNVTAECFLSLHFELQQYGFNSFFPYNIQFCQHLT